VTLSYAESKQSFLRVNFFGAKDIPDAENLDLQKYSETAEMLMCKLLPDILMWLFLTIWFLLKSSKTI